MDKDEQTYAYEYYDAHVWSCDKICILKNLQTAEKSDKVKVSKKTGKKMYHTIRQKSV